VREGTFGEVRNPIPPLNELSKGGELFLALGLGEKKKECIPPN
jgi:hypothetical protein